MPIREDEWTKELIARREAIIREWSDAKIMLTIVELNVIKVSNGTTTQINQTRKAIQVIINSCHRLKNEILEMKRGIKEVRKKRRLLREKKKENDIATGT